MYYTLSCKNFTVFELFVFLRDFSDNLGDLDFFPAMYVCISIRVAPCDLKNLKHKKTF